MQIGGGLGQNLFYKTEAQIRGNPESMLADLQDLERDLDLVVDTIVKQALASDSAKILQKPDFWTLGYAGGCCLFVLGRANMGENDPVFHVALISTFSKIFGTEKAPRLVSYFLTFLHSPELVTDILDLDRDSYNKDYLAHKDEELFLQRVRGIYRVEVFEKFVSLSVSINEVVMDAKHQAEQDMQKYGSGGTAVEPEGLMRHLQSAPSEFC